MAARCIDIEGLANYLGMTVVFETFAEEDRDKVGFLADGRTPLKVRRKGSIVSFCFPLGTIVLDSFLRQDKKSGRRRFTIAHEIAHSVIEKHNPVPQFHRIYDSEHGYTFQELKAQLTMTENQADQLVAVIRSHYLIPFYNGARHMAFMLHGHTHKTEESVMEERIKEDIRRKGLRCEAYNVGAMRQNYEPQTFEEIIARQGRKISLI